MLVCKNLLRRLAENMYCSLEYEDFFERYPMEFVPCVDGRASKLRELPDSASKEFQALMQKEDTLYKHDLELFWKIFNRAHRGWWS